MLPVAEFESVVEAAGQLQRVTLIRTDRPETSAASGGTCDPSPPADQRASDGCREPLAPRTVARNDRNVLGLAISAAVLRPANDRHVLRLAPCGAT